MSDVLSTTSVSFSEDLRTSVAATKFEASSQSLLQELELEITEKMNQMRALAERLAIRLESNFRSEMVRLPKHIRAMKMREFCVNYGGDVDEAIKQQAKRARVGEMLPPPPVLELPAQAAPLSVRAARSRGVVADQAPTSVRKTAPSTSRRCALQATPQAGGRNTRTRGILATPNATCANGRTSVIPAAFTPRVNDTPRAAQRGEIVLSANGSPINILDTVKAKAGRRGGCS